MSETCVLNVETVESLQRAAARGRSLDVLGRFNDVTLAGLLEYGCLRYAYPDVFPIVPGMIAETQLACLLRDVASPLGIRCDGPKKPPVKDIGPRSAEFHLLPDLDSMESDVDWQCFLTRFERSGQKAGFSKRESGKLLSAFWEMSENALLHSCSPVNPLVGYVAATAVTQFSVVDVGIGVWASLRKNPLHEDLDQDVAAIQRSLQPGVTSRSDGRGGLGFQSVFKALAEQWGQLRFRSGNGSVSISGIAVGADQCLRSYPPILPGFQVSVCCRTEAPGSSISAF